MKKAEIDGKPVKKAQRAVIGDEICLDVKDEDGEERDFLLVPTEHGIFPVLRRDKRGGQHNE